VEDVVVEEATEERERDRNAIRCVIVYLFGDEINQINGDKNHKSMG
jgi:hypothetical protein